MKLVSSTKKWNQAAAFYVRMEVFVLEQGIALEEEFDAFDRDDTLYLVLYDENKPVATGRYLKIDADTIRPGRIAVLPSHRGRGLGKRIVEEMEAVAKKEQCTTSVIHGEMTAAPFYEKLGYVKVSEPYYEDGALCVTLEKRLRPNHSSLVK